MNVLILVSMHGSACKLYESAKDLVDACIVSSLDLDIRRQLEQYSRLLQAKQLDVRRRGDELLLFGE